MNIEKELITILLENPKLRDSVDSIKAYVEGLIRAEYERGFTNGYDEGFSAADNDGYIEDEFDK